MFLNDRNTHKITILIIILYSGTNINEELTPLSDNRASILQSLTLSSKTFRSSQDKKKNQLQSGRIRLDLMIEWRGNKTMKLYLLLESLSALCIRLPAHTGWMSIVLTFHQISRARDIIPTTRLFFRKCIHVLIDITIKHIFLLLYITIFISI